MSSVAEQSMIGGLRNLGRRHELIWLLTLDALRKQFAGSILGLGWVLLKPMLLVGIYALLFTTIFRPAVSPGSGDIPYLLVLLSGVVPWLLLAEPLAAAAGSIATNAPLLTKVLFPTEVLPVSRVLASSVSGCVALLLLMAMLAWQGRADAWWAALPAVMALQLLFVLGLGWMAAALSVTFPDFSQALPFLLNLWMLLSPVVYSPEMLPPAWRAVAEVNPMWHVIGLYRSLLLDQAAPAVGHLAVFSVWAVACFLGGYLMFMKRRTMFADVI